MPRFMQCVNGEHYYIRAALGKVPITYQLTPKGLRYLLNDLGLKPRDQFGWEHLETLLEEGWAYTAGSGVQNRLPNMPAEITTNNFDTVQEEFGPPHRFEQRTWLLFESTDPGVLDTTISRLTELLCASSGVIEGPYPLPTRSEQYTAICSEGHRIYTMHTHKRLLVVIGGNSGLFGNGLPNGLPAGVSLRVRMRSLIVEAADCA